ncbi:MAG: hypothetical protein QNJ54_36060 [Prochloraceae cyanobacterium]|nr:hypothetical protein [Prochloraceae cyanobacterium]
MATNKPRITAYVKQEVFDKFEDFCKQSDVKHSRGIELILSKFFSGDTPSTLLSNTISDEALNAKIDERLASVTHQSDTGNALIEAIEERLDDQAKKLAEVLDRMTLLEEKISDTKSGNSDVLVETLSQRVSLLEEKISDIKSDTSNTPVQDKASQPKSDTPVKSTDNQISELNPKKGDKLTTDQAFEIAQLEHHFDGDKRAFRQRYTDAKKRKNPDKVIFGMRKLHDEKGIYLYVGDTKT